MKNKLFEISKKQWFLLFICLLAISINSFAQVKRKKTEIKGNENTYKCNILTRELEKGQVRKTKYYNNTNFNFEEIHNERKPNSVDAYFISYRMDNHDKFITALGKAFSKERIDFLSKNEIKFHVEFILDKKGNIIAISFCSIGENDVTPFELEIIEKELMQNITFKPKEHHPEAYPDSYPVRTSFKEIQQGEIITIRKKEKRKY